MGTVYKNITSELIYIMQAAVSYENCWSLCLRLNRLVPYYESSPSATASHILSLKFLHGKLSVVASRVVPSLTPYT